MSGNNVDDLISSVNKELVNVTEWLDASKLSLNVSKIHCMIFRSQGMHNPVATRPLIIKNETIKRDHKTKFLGVILDEKLIWVDHILYIKGKIAKGLGIICKARKLLNAETLHTLYYCFVYPYMNYCIDVLGDRCKSYLEPLVKLQKKVLRIISYSGFNYNVDNVFKKLEIMQIRKIHLYKAALVMFKVKADLSAPAVLCDLFRENKSADDYDTRQRENFHVPQA